LMMLKVKVVLNVIIHQRQVGYFVLRWRNRYGKLLRCIFIPVAEVSRWLAEHYEWHPALKMEGLTERLARVAKECPDVETRKELRAIVKEVRKRWAS